jgi:hypothetical protein
MLVQGRWVAVPEIAIQYRTLLGDNGETNGGHWCGVILNEAEGASTFLEYTRCAILPPNFSLGPSAPVR